MKTNKEMIQHFKNLLNMVIADPSIGAKEMMKIYELGIDKGMTKEMIDEFLLDPNEIQFTIPNTAEEKITILYDLALVIWADEVVDPEEEELMKRVAVSCGFNEEDVLEITHNILSKVKSGISLSYLLRELKEGEKRFN